MPSHQLLDSKLGSDRPTGITPHHMYLPEPIYAEIDYTPSWQRQSQGAHRTEQRRPENVVMDELPSSKTVKDTHKYLQKYGSTVYNNPVAIVHPSSVTQQQLPIMQTSLPVIQPSIPVTQYSTPVTQSPKYETIKPQFPEYVKIKHYKNKKKYSKPLNRPAIPLLLNSAPEYTTIPPPAYHNLQQIFGEDKKQSNLMINRWVQGQTSKLGQNNSRDIRTLNLQESDLDFMETSELMNETGSTLNGARNTVYVGDVAHKNNVVIKLEDNEDINRTVHDPDSLLYNEIGSASLVGGKHRTVIAVNKTDSYSSQESEVKRSSIPLHQPLTNNTVVDAHTGYQYQLNDHYTVWNLGITSLHPGDHSTDSKQGNTELNTVDKIVDGKNTDLLFGRNWDPYQGYYSEDLDSCIAVKGAPLNSPPITMSSSDQPATKQVITIGNFTMSKPPADNFNEKSIFTASDDGLSNNKSTNPFNDETYEMVTNLDDIDLSKYGEKDNTSDNAGYNRSKMASIPPLDLAYMQTMAMKGPDSPVFVVVPSTSAAHMDRDSSLVTDDSSSIMVTGEVKDHKHNSSIVERVQNIENMMHGAEPLSTTVPAERPKLKSALSPEKHRKFGDGKKQPVKTVMFDRIDQEGEFVVSTRRHTADHQHSQVLPTPKVSVYHPADRRQQFNLADRRDELSGTQYDQAWTGHPHMSNNEELYAPGSNYSEESPPPAPRGSAKKSLFKQSLAKLQGYAAGHNYVRGEGSDLSGEEESAVTRYHIPTAADDTWDRATHNPPEGIGCCGYLLLICSWFVIILTMPLSLCLCIKVVQEYERAVIFRLGRLLPGGAKGPGLFVIIPCMDNYIKVDLRTISFDVPPQEVLSKDSVTVAVDAVVYYRISNATVSITNVEDANRSTRLLAATTLRNTLGTKNLSEILSDRENISHMMQSSLDEATDPWGVKVERVEIKDVRLPVQLQRAMAAEAEAAREARAKVIAAEGEHKASRALRDAADVLSQSSSALQLRYLQTLNTISAEKNSTIIFPLPIDMLQSFARK